MNPSVGVALVNFHGINLVFFVEGYLGIVLACCISSCHDAVWICCKILKIKRSDLFSLAHLPFEKPQQHPYCHHGQRAACAQPSVQFNLFLCKIFQVIFV